MGANFIIHYVTGMGQEKKSENGRQNRNHNNNGFIFMYKYAILTWINAIFFI